jgi:hypothetical protein
MRTIPTFLTILAIAALGACGRSRFRIGDDWRAELAKSGPMEFQDAKKAEDASAADPSKSQDSKSAEESPSILMVLLLYIPNRIFDAGDVVRAGVNLGPGIGADLCATESLSVAAMFRTSVGVGYETLRHMPVVWGGESYAAVGPVSSKVVGGPIWYRQYWDIRPELHVVLVGAHVAVNPAEIADFFLGFTTIDIMNDDYK